MSSIIHVELTFNNEASKCMPSPQKELKSEYHIKNNSIFQDIKIALKHFNNCSCIQWSYTYLFRVKKKKIGLKILIWP